MFIVVGSTSVASLTSCVDLSLDDKYDLLSIPIHLSKMVLLHIFATGVVLAALASCGDGQKAFEFATTCPLASQRFDIASLSCRDCTQPNSVASSDGRDFQALLVATI